MSKLVELCENRGDIVREEKARRGCPVLGTLCSYVPVEIVHSMGILPVRLWGRADDVDEADSLMQPFICPPVRHLMALGLEGSYDFLDGLVHCYTCDATCGLYNIWARNMRPGFFHLISLPYMDIAESRRYARAEFESFISGLEAFAGREFSPDGLQRSVDLYAGARSLISEAYRLKSSGVPLDYADVHRMSLCLHTLPLETTLPLLEDCLEEARGMEPETGGRKRILLSGSVLFDTDLVEFVESNGGTIVADDTCFGRRLVKDNPGEAPDPLDALTAYYLGRTPCASRADFPARRAALLEAVERFEVEAVMFVHQKFCDPHLSDHPFMKEVLSEAGVPSMQLELEGESFNSQIRTRVEGFLEMIGAR